MGKQVKCVHCSKVLKEGEGIETATLENEETHVFCNECYGEDAPEKVKRGRPSLGKTAKISLTITEEEWAKFDEKANGNRSSYIRKLVLKDIEPNEFKLPKFYFKDDLHEKLMYHYIQLMGIHPTDTIAVAGCYVLASLTSKRFDDVIVKGARIKPRALQKKIAPYSPTEKNLVGLGVQLCCGPKYDSTPLIQIFSGLDRTNTRIVHSALRYVYPM